MEAPVGLSGYVAVIGLSPAPTLAGRAAPRAGGGRPRPYGYVDAVTSLPPAILRLVLGGKVEGYSGAMPGIAEEYLADRLANRPVLVLGKYGGCAGLIANYLLGPFGDAIPERLTWAWASAQPFYRNVAALDAELGLQARWDALANQLRLDRAALATNRSWVSGLDAAALRVVMASESDGAIIHAALAALGGR